MILITDAPSGSGRRSALTSMATIKDSYENGEIDYCAIEIKEALNYGKMVVPVSAIALPDISARMARPGILAILP